MEIREARPSDLPALVELWREFMAYHCDLDPDYQLSADAIANWEKYVRSKFEDQMATMFVAVDGGVMLGYIGAVVRDYPPVFTMDRYGFVEEIAVTRAFRRRGIGRKLWSAAEAWLLGQGIERIRVNIDTDNDASQGFFRRLGFGDHTQSLIRKY
jgi:ribosomal protein S18 acetylase RimI-like enzyme